MLYETDESSFDVFAAGILKEKLEVLQNTNTKINIGLSGGRTPLPIYNLLKDFDLKWELFNFFMVDERFVSVKSDQSNYKNIYDSFFKHIPSNNYPMVKEGYQIDTAVEAYIKALKTHIPTRNHNQPFFDLILLGMGEDGHTASLFSGTEALNENTQSVVKNYVPKLNSHRITLTFPVIKNSGEAIVLIKGEKKRKIVEELYTLEESIYPIHKLVKSDLKMSWIISKN